jgi:hypothetical protein
MRAWRSKRRPDRLYAFHGESLLPLMAAFWRGRLARHRPVLCYGLQTQTSRHRMARDFRTTLARTRSCILAMRPFERAKRTSHALSTFSPQVCAAPASTDVKSLERVSQVRTTVPTDRRLTFDRWCGCTRSRRQSMPGRRYGCIDGTERLRKSDWEERLSSLRRSSW